MTRPPLCLSIFTVESIQKPNLAFAAKWYAEAEKYCKTEDLRAKLRIAESGGVPLFDDLPILHLRLANLDERARFRESAAGDMSALVFLVDVDSE